MEYYKKMINVLDIELDKAQLEEAVLNAIFPFGGFDFPVAVITPATDYLVRDMEEFGRLARYKLLDLVGEWPNVFISEMPELSKKSEADYDHFVGSDLFWAMVAERGKEDPLLAILCMDHLQRKWENGLFEIHVLDEVAP